MTSLYHSFGSAMLWPLILVQLGLHDPLCVGERLFGRLAVELGGLHGVVERVAVELGDGQGREETDVSRARRDVPQDVAEGLTAARAVRQKRRIRQRADRSEEHTSELQS